MDGFDIEVAGDAEGEARTADIGALRAALRNNGVRFGELVLKRKSMDAPSSEAMGVFRIALDQAENWAPVVVAYLVGRMGRKVSITVGDTKVEATSKEEIERLIPLVDELRASKKKKE